jgi:hypothetical protein
LREVLDGRATLVECGDMKALLDAAESARRPAPSAPSWSWVDAASATWGVYERASRPPARPSAHGSAVTLRRRAAQPGRLDGLEPR